MAYHMPYSQYCRIESIAGGVMASDRAFIRAARSRLRPDAARSADPEVRRLRHEYYREGLAMRERARREFVAVTTGRI